VAVGEVWWHLFVFVFVRVFVFVFVRVFVRVRVRVRDHRHGLVSIATSRTNKDFTSSAVVCSASPRIRKRSTIALHSMAEPPAAA
jgi:hypothetical protein